MGGMSPDMTGELGDSPTESNENSLDTESSRRRRDVLKAISMGPVMHFDASVLGISNSVKTVEIPVVKKDDKVLKWKEVPQKWWSHELHAREVVQKAHDYFLDMEGVASVGQGIGTDTIAGRNAFEITIGIDPEQSPPDLPETFEGLSVGTRVADGDLLKCSNLQRFDPAPGGVTLEGQNGPGSAAFKVTSTNGRVGMLTAHHLFSCLGDVTGYSGYQCGTKVGEVGQNDTSADFAIVRGDSPFDSTIREEDGTTWETAGYKTEAAIGDMISSGEHITRTGVAYGTTQGPIREKRISEQYSCSLDFDGHGVRVEADAAEGDSGGPGYNVENILNQGSQAVIVNIANKGHKGRSQYFNCSCSCGGNVCDSDRQEYDEYIGTAFYHLHDNHGITIY